MSVLLRQMASALRSALTTSAGRQGMAQVALLGGLLLAAPLGMGSKASRLLVRESVETGSEATTSAPSSVPAWAQTCHPPLDCEAVQAQRIQRIRSGTLVRSLALVPDKVLEVYRDASGRLDVVERSRRAGAAEEAGRSVQGGVVPESGLKGFWPGFFHSSLPS